MELDDKTVLKLRHDIQANTEAEQPEDPLPDERSETDKMFQNAGKKSELHPDPADPPRSPANKQRGHDTYHND